MRKYKHSDLSHLKYRMITQDKLTPKEAEERIKQLKEWEQKIKVKKLKGGKKKYDKRI